VHHTKPVLQCSFWYLGNADMALTDPWSGEDDDTDDDDTDYGYYDTPSDNIWRPRRRARAALRRRTRVAAFIFPSLIVRTWHHRPERGPVRP
jgi:hypothetical protein